MRKIIRKLFWVWDFEKEEKWLNEMAAKGLCLVSVGFCRYEFEDCVPGEYNIRLELLKNSPKHPESQGYIEFIEETGAEHIGTFNKWIYLRKKTVDGTFELFSDNASRIRHLKRIICAFLPIALMNIPIGINNLILFFGKTSEIYVGNGVIGLINIFFALWLTFGCYRLYRKKKRLQKETQIFE